MRNALRWAIAVGAALCVIGLAAYARGPEHHRGDQIGSHGTKVVIVRVEER
jgi:hypothetical protein